MWLAIQSTPPSACPKTCSLAIEFDTRPRLVCHISEVLFAGATCVMMIKESWRKSVNSIKTIGDDIFRLLRTVQGDLKMMLSAYCDRTGVQ